MAEHNELGPTLYDVVNSLYAVWGEVPDEWRDYFSWELLPNIRIECGVLVVDGVGDEELDCEYGVESLLEDDAVTDDMYVALEERLQRRDGFMTAIDKAMERSMASRQGLAEDESDSDEETAHEN